ncbi:MAG: alpha/beta fold hydrolase [Paludibacter sp.]|nr:alpha/beta fold hydrolase [Paludibacter sp.]
MKKIFLLFVLFIFAQNSNCQDITGTWNGVLNIQVLELHIVFHIEKTDDGYSATMDSPDQGAKGIPVKKVDFNNSQLTILMPELMAQYTGELLDNDTIKGIFTQRSIPIVLNLSRGEIVQNRPQTPKPPYPYKSIEVSFKNETDSSIVLSGTLTIPKGDGKFPAVVLVSGSGAQNRDEEIFEHKPFLVLADYLTRNGIAVLRYDDRGTAKSTGSFSTATTYDFSTDAQSAFNFLKKQTNINPQRVGFIGHSEGGIIAPMIAARDKNVDFIVSLAGTGISGDELLLLQQEAIATASGINRDEIMLMHNLNKTLFEMIKNTTDSAQLHIQIVNYLKKAKEDNPKIVDDNTVQTALAQIDNPWMQYFIRYNPQTAWENVHCAVLALNGERDLQVPYNENLTAIKSALEKGGNKNVTIKSFPALNHLFQPCTSGLPTEYGKIEITMSEDVLKTITDWILNQK